MKAFPKKKLSVIYLITALILYLGWVVLQGAASPRGLALSEEERASYKVIDRQTTKQPIDEGRKQRGSE